jgi:hypothetical protein
LNDSKFAVVGEVESERKGVAFAVVIKYDHQWIERTIRLKFDYIHPIPPVTGPFGSSI